ncbi:pseudouridylate synthase PUS7L isoform X1 [Rhincodon typus]|uniref:pseudouridylate synthase PUS7L isoform X1 n=1 Tax=Rhincodon typus TaxID=259920 RepID=UPI0009A430D4|nr:pseudouridylate synthase PUS7L isoform X1 [Rhincodon typus]XP_048463549.1 pseudouridylate synthase PUS7L isoform X1 [Rhincodon typus]XP_048463550.1 pseudouridylate synthase PUS7L isoform X1 [Rhincodon typus]
MDGMSLCWVSDHTGFRGIIKNSASDFVVTEINMHGQLVSDVEADCSQDSDNIESEQEKAHPIQKKRMKKPEKALETFSGLPIFDKLKDANVVHGKVNQTADSNLPESAANSPSLQVSETQGGTLHLLLGSSLSEKLEKFASLAKERKAAEQEGTEDKASLLLGTFEEKCQRAAIHLAVRQKFPFLKTVTSCGEIEVRLDPQYSELCQLVSEEEANGFFGFLDSRDRSSKFTFQSDQNKEHRKAIHHFVSKYFGKLVETKSFLEQDGSSDKAAVITVRFRGKITSGRKRNANDCQAVPTTYTAFTLCKVNMETLEAIACLASELGVVASDFSYAGIKDKKAITSQSMVVKNVTINRLKAKQLSIQSKGLNVYNLRRATEHLRIGQLKGNHFSIIIRNVSKHQEDDPNTSLADQVFEAIENVKEKGFVNYYGPQRFGLGQNVQADQVGLALLEGKLVEAVHLVFTPEEGDDPVNQAKRHFIQTGDAKGTLALMPEYKTRERMMLRALNRYGNNREGCARAWLSLPHSMRVLYIHSYCSKVWNKAASFRLKTYDLKVVEGDLVACDNLEWDPSNQDNSQVHIVTTEDLKSNIYSINQVVLPMPGNSVQYPCNKLALWYQETLAQDGLKECKFRIPALQLNIPGCYRRLLAQPQQLLFRWLEDKEVPFTKEGCELVTDDSKQPHEVRDSLSVSFSLNSSCYATVCLREIMKCNV